MIRRPHTFRDSASDGALGLVLTNWGDEAQPIELEVPLTEHEPGADSAKVVDLTSDKPVATVAEDGVLRLKLDMAPRRARMLEIQSVQSR